MVAETLAIGKPCREQCQIIYSIFGTGSQVLYMGRQLEIAGDRNSRLMIVKTESGLRLTGLSARQKRLKGERSWNKGQYGKGWQIFGYYL